MRALSLVAGIQFCNEQQLAQRPVLGAASLTPMNVSFVACLAVAFVQTLNHPCSHTQK